MLKQYMGRRLYIMGLIKAAAGAFGGMSDRRTEQCGTVLLCYSEQSELRVEVDELLNDNLLNVATASFHSIVKSLFQIGFAL